MSVTMERPQAAWQTHPGWGIAADLTPREVVAARQVRVNQRLIVLALLLVVGLCVSVSLLAKADQASAERAYEQEQARTAELVASSAEYDVITTMQTVIAQIKGQLTTAMTDDVDLVNLMARLRTSVPTGLEISNEAVLLTPPVAAGAVTDPATGATTTTGGAQVIGTITISGTGARVRDVTPFVAKLNQLRGIVDVVPTSVNQTDAGMAFTLSMNLTDLLYTHRYDATADPAAGAAADSSTATDPEVAP